MTVQILRCQACEVPVRVRFGTDGDGNLTECHEPHDCAPRKRKATQTERIMEAVRTGVCMDCKDAPVHKKNAHRCAECRRATEKAMRARYWAGYKRKDGR